MGDEINETAEQKRIRMAKIYLNDVEEEVLRSAEDEDNEEGKEEYDGVSKVSSKLRRDRLEYQRRLLRSYSGIVEKKNMQHISLNSFSGHNQPVTTVSLSADASFVVSGS